MHVRRTSATATAVAMACAATWASVAPASASTPDGYLDTSFATTGQIVTDLGHASVEHDIKVQSDGKVLAVGFFVDGPAQGVLARYNTSGQLDETFDSDGLVSLLPSASTNVVPYAVDTQSTGAIIVAGEKEVSPGESDLFITRLGVDGALDETFGTSGYTVPEFPVSTEYAYELAVLNDDSIVVVGRQSGATLKMLIGRFDKDGIPIESFGTHGIVIQAIGPTSFATDVAVQTDGDFLVAGLSWDGDDTKDYAFVARFSGATGALDETFGTSGVATTELTSVRIQEAPSADLALQSDGRMLLSAADFANGVVTPVVVRISADGSLDPSFGTAGTARIELGLNARSYDVSIDAYGRVIVVGSIATLGPDPSDALVVRLTSDGSLDPSFGTSGWVHFDSGSNQENVLTSVDFMDDEVMVGGRSIICDSYSACYFGFSVALLVATTADGILDQSFGNLNSGTAMIDAGMNVDVMDVALQPDGKIVVIGSANDNGRNDIFVARFTETGAPDPTFFDANGYRTVVMSDLRDSFGYAVDVQLSGRIIVAGYHDTASAGEDPLLLALDSDGRIDSEFGDSGYSWLSPSANDDGFYGVTVAADGSITAVGRDGGTGTRFLIARYSAGGILDDSFGGSGVVTTAITDAAQATEVALVGDGSVVVAGTSEDLVSGKDFTLARYLADGQLDGNFGTGGIVSTAFGPLDTADVPFGIAIDGDGKAVVAGVSLTATSAMIAARYDTSGVLDGTFGTNGRVTIDRGAATSGRGVAVDPDNRIILVGSQYDAVAGTNDSITLRLRPSGDYDKSFGSSGVVVFGTGNEERLEGVALRADNRIVVGGVGTTGGHRSPSVSRIFAAPSTLAPPPPSTDATLSSLTLSDGTLSPDFDSLTTSYTASVPYATSSVAVTPTCNDAGASITVNGTAVTSGSPITLDLSVGDTTVSVVVTAADSVTSQTYSVVVTRGPGDVATLASLAITDGALSPSFDSATVDYTATVPPGSHTIEVVAVPSDDAATMTLDGGAATSGEAVSVSLPVGDTTVTIVVTGADAVTTMTYTITVTREASSDATLASLSLSAGTLSPGFDSATTNYAASVTNATSSANVTPTCNDPGASVTVNGAAVTSGSPEAVSLAVGGNTLTILVTAEDGITTTTYTVTVTRAASTNATLTSLTLSAGALSPVFAPGTLTYRATVANTVKNLVVSPVRAATGATVRVNGTIVAPGSGVTRTLALGSNLISVVVTAPDAVTTRTYSLTITRDVATLKTKSTMTAAALLASVDVTPLAGAAVTVTVAKASKSFCTVTGTSIKGTKTGTCTVTVSMTPKPTKTMKKPKAVTTAVTVRIA